MQRPCHPCTRYSNLVVHDRQSPLRELVDLQDHLARSRIEALLHQRCDLGQSSTQDRHDLAVVAPEDLQLFTQKGIRRAPKSYVVR